MGIREIVINNYVKNGDTCHISLSILHVLIIYILLIIMKMSLNDRNWTFWGTWELNIWCFSIGFINGFIKRALEYFENNYIGRIINERGVRELYLKNMRRRELDEHKKRLIDVSGNKKLYKQFCCLEEKHIKSDRDRVLLIQFESFQIN